MSIKISFGNKGSPFEDMEAVTAKANQRALSRTVSYAQTHIVKSLKENFTIQSKAVKSSMRVRKDDKSGAAQIIVSGPPLGIDKYSVKPKYDTTGSSRRPVIVSVTRGVNKTVGNGFIWQGHVFRRQTDGRLPIEKVVGPAVAQILDTPEVLEEISENTQEFYEKRLNHEIDHLMGKDGS